MSYLLDTNIISEFARSQPDSRVQAWVRQRSANELHLSTITIAELARGAYKKIDIDRGARLLRWIENDLTQQFAGRILPFDKSAAGIWGQLMGSGDRTGQTLPAADALIASIALAHELTVITRNVKDFEHMTASTINPFDEVSAGA